MPNYTELKEELDVLKNKKAQLDKGWLPLRAEAREIDAKIKELESAIKNIKLAPRISDHAMLRYLQRKYKVDFNELRNEILTESVISAINLGASAITVDGFKLMIHDKCVTTILDKDMHSIPRSKSRMEAGE